MQKWIPVTDRLPQKDVRFKVWLTVDGPGGPPETVQALWVFDEFRAGNGKPLRRPVTAWMEYKTPVPYGIAMGGRNAEKQVP